MLVLMTGATGAKASLVLPELLRRDITVRALVRSQDKAAIALATGATETAIGDLRDRASLDAAMEGVDAVFHINPAFAPDEAELGLAMVAAARAEGVDKFVFSSVYHPSMSLTNHAFKRPVEEALYTSDMTYVVLQPAMFMQNLVGMLAPAQQGRITMPYSPTSRMSYVDYRDVAEVVGIAMGTARLDNGTFELAAQGMTDNQTIAATFADALGATVTAERVEFDEWADHNGMPHSPLRDGMSRMHREYDKHGFHGGNGLVLETILGRPPRSLSAFVRDLVAR